MKVFVFGSNLAGVHGAGAALYALKHHGAICGQGIGLQGQSYGIPTKDSQIKTLPLEAIALFVQDFLTFAAMHPEMEFQVTKIGTGLAGYSHHQIAPMFRGAPRNCNFDPEWLEYLK